MVHITWRMPVSKKPSVDMSRLATEPTPIHIYDDRDESGRKLAMVYACRVKWDELELTNSDLVRYCTNCSQPVFQVADRNDFERAVAARRCVMVKPKGARDYLLGAPSIGYDPNPKLQWDEE